MIYEAVKHQLQHGPYKNIKNIYGSGDSSNKITNVLSEISLDNIIQKRLYIKNE